MSLLLPQPNRMYVVTDPPGICLVINIRHYEPETALAERRGSEIDVERVLRLFGERLHFSVIIREDLTGPEIHECVESLVASSQEAMQSHGCFVCVLMAHGSNEKVIGRDGTSQGLAELTRLVDSRACPALAHKPKVFIVHAARSARPEVDALAGSSTGEEGEGEAEVESGLAFTNFRLHDMDFLVCFANTEGAPVLDDPRAGSAYLQAVCQLVEAEHQVEHLDDMLTDVNRHLKCRPVQRPNGRLCYYVPEKVSSLTRKCYVDPAMAAGAAGPHADNS